MFDTLFIVLPEREANLDLASLSAKLAQVLAAHGDCDRLCDVGGRQPDQRRPFPVDRNAHFVIAGLGIGTHVLESFYG